MWSHCLTVTKQTKKIAVERMKKKMVPTKQTNDGRRREAK